MKKLTAENAHDETDNTIMSNTLVHQAENQEHNTSNHRSSNPVYQLRKTIQNIFRNNQSNGSSSETAKTINTTSTNTTQGKAPSISPIQVLLANVPQIANEDIGGLKDRLNLSETSYLNNIHSVFNTNNKDHRGDTIKFSGRSQFTAEYLNLPIYHVKGITHQVLSQIKNMTVSNQSSFADVKYLEKKDDHSSRPMVYASELNVDLSSENNMPLSEKRL